MGVDIVKEMSLEKEMKAMTGREFVLSMRSGSMVLIASLISLGIAEGSEVIIPSICCPAVLFSVANAGFTPVVADVSCEDFCMHKENILAVATDNTKAIIAVHAYGRYCPIVEIENLAKEKGWFLLEDACLGMGGSFNEKPFGSFGDVSIFSFGYDKLIDLKEGGIFATDNPIFFDKCKTILDENSFFGYRDSTQKQEEFRTKFVGLQENIKQRNQNASIYYELLSDEKVQKPAHKEDIVYWRYCALYKGDRERLVEKGKENGVIITTHYKGLHQLRTGEVLENAEHVTHQIINLFVNPEKVTSEIIHKTIDFINEFEG